MPLIGIPDRITPELLYTLARMGHGDRLVIADANFPSDSVAAETVIKEPIRVLGDTHDVLQDILLLLPLDSYSVNPVVVMDRVSADKEKNLVVNSYDNIMRVSGKADLFYEERFRFYELAKKSFAIVQTTDRNLYSNVIVTKGVL